MEALILSCGTGGGHNSAGRAVEEALRLRGWNVTMLDPYTLVDDDLAKKVNDTYIKVAQRSRHLFGAIYKIGALYSQLPVHSPVYFVNRGMVPVLADYLREHPVDVIVCPHIFPGEILTAMKDQGIAVPPMIFVATDDTCIPFTGECSFDYFCIPSPALWGEFTAKGIPGQKLVVTGIPVKRAFSNPVSKEDAKRLLSLEQDKHYILLSGGSIGAGKMKQTVRTVRKFLNRHQDYRLIAVCGSNEALFRQMARQVREDSRVTVLSSTRDMALYMRSCDVFLSKPGGLSSAEAASMGVPLVHLPPIPGCETRNRAFFSGRCMSIAVDTPKQLLETLESIPGTSEKIVASQRLYCLADGADRIADLCRYVVSQRKKQEA